MIDLTACRDTEGKRLKRRGGLGLLGPRRWGLRWHLCPVPRRAAWAGLLLLLASVPALAQYTAVSATVKDPNGNPYASGSWQANLNLANVPVGSLVKFQGSTSFQTSYVGQLDASGKFTVSLPDNNVITPVGNTQWTFKFCQFYSTATQSPSPACFSLTLTITGASMDITSQVQAASVPLSLPTVVPLPLSTLNGGTGTGTPGLAFGNPLALSSPVTGLEDKGGQVFNVKAYGAKGDGTTDDTAAIQAAINAMPSCMQGANTWTHCGPVYLPLGTYKVTSSLLIFSPFVTIAGASEEGTTIDYRGITGCAIQWTATPFNTTSGNSLADGISDIAIEGTNASAGTCGLKTYDIVGLNINRVSIYGFTGAGSSGWWDTAITAFNERYHVGHLTLENNAIGWLVQNQNTGGVNNTFGYGEFGLRITAQSGQIGVKSLGQNTSNGVFLDDSVASIVENGTSATCAVFNTQSHWRLSGNWHCEGTSMVGGFQTDATSTFAINGTWDSPGTDSGTIISMTPDEASALNFLFENANPATSSVSQGSATMIFRGSYWNGSSSQPDNWSFQTAVAGGANGASTFIIQHNGSSGVAALQAPQLILPALAGGGNATLSGPTNAAGFDQISLPDANGPLVVLGSRGISAKTVTLAAGTATWTFATAYISAPVCTASDNTAANAVRVEPPLTTSVKVDGTTTDSVSIICTPAAN